MNDILYGVINELDSISGSMGVGTEYYKGKDGYTPVKGVDYFTQEDIDEIIKDINGVDLTEYAKKAELAKVSTTGEYSDLKNKPTLFDGDYNSLTNKPTLFSGDYNDLNNKPTLFDGNYNSLTNKPDLFSGNYEDLTNKPTIPDAYTLPIASTDTLGGVKVDGETITIADGVISSAGGGGSVSVDGTSIIQNEDGTISTAIGGSKTLVEPETVLMSYEDEVGFTKAANNSLVYSSPVLTDEEASIFNSLDKTKPYLLEIVYRNNNTNEARTLTSKIIYTNSEGSNTYDWYVVTDIYIPTADRIKYIELSTDKKLVFYGTKSGATYYQVYYIISYKISQEVTYQYNTISSGVIPIGKGLRFDEENNIATDLSIIFKLLEYDGIKTKNLVLSDSLPSSFNDVRVSYNLAIGKSPYLQTAARSNLLVGDHCTVDGGNNNILSGYNNSVRNSSRCLVSGYQVSAQSDLQTVLGRGNIIDSSGTYYFIIGNGTSGSGRANALTVDTTGNLAIAGTMSSSGADYAEYFEWKDHNPEAEDRVGYIVALDGDKITLANEGDYILGVVSGTATVLGDNAEWNWVKRWLTDDFGRVQYEDVVIHHEAEGEIPAYDETVRAPIVNPDYDPEQTYTKRADRPEWSAVGMMGKLYVRDDGTCQVNGYCKPVNGVATSSTTGMRVIERVSDNVIRVVLK